jgi:heterodisulfide reductase subunit A
MDTLVEAGLNKYLFEFANIRNQCSWVHSDDKKHATEKAKDLIRMAVAKVRLVGPLYEQEVSVTQRSLVVGGGIAGMRAALALAKMGIETVLVEKERELGGRLRDLYSLFPADVKAKDVLTPLRKEVLLNPKIIVRTGTDLKDIQGFIGNFVGFLTSEDKEEKIEFGTAIIATGFREIDMTGKYGYKQFKRVVTQTDLERMFRDGTINDLGHPRSVVMINCAGAMTPERPYCCRIGCGVSIKNAKILKQFFPDAKVYILYRDMRIFGKEEEEYYSKVITEQRVLTFRYPGDKAPEVVDEAGVLKVRFWDDVLREDMEIEADLVVLTAETEGDITTEAIKKMFKVPTAVGDFFVEAHAKIRPLDFSTDGVYVAGSAHFPKSLADTIAQAEGAASRAAIPILRGRLTLEGTISSPVDEKCDGCAFCIETCPFKAITLVEYMKNGEVKKTIQVNEALCKGCGCCMATCPKEGVDVRGYTLQQLKAQAKEAIETSGEMEPDTEYEPRLVAFCCNWCSYAGADLAGVTRIQYPHNVRIVRVMCSGMVHPNMVMDSLMNGADGVLICGCHIGDCHYLTGNERTKTRAESIALMLQDFGLEPERFRLEWVSASEGIRFAEVMKSMVDDLKKLGPSPYSKRT